MARHKKVDCGSVSHTVEDLVIASLFRASLFFLLLNVVALSCISMRIGISFRLELAENSEKKIINLSACIYHDGLCGHASVF